MADSRRPLTTAVYLLTVFCSAFLLFQVQPLISRFILPWFGGSPAVWTTCMLFFQAILFAGYVYADVVVRRLPAKAQGLLHIVLLGAACAALPIIPSEIWKPTEPGNPSSHILLLLLATVGLPYFVLSTTGPLLQSWFVRTMPGRSPWRLYALSNAGSLIALLTYPFVVEPLLPTGTQAEVWSWAFYGFAGCCVLCAAIAMQAGKESSGASSGEVASEGGGEEPAADATSNEAASDPETDAKPPSGWDVLLWASLAAVPSVMLLATTNQVCTDIAVVPFLWVLPLSLYLLTFILCFDSDWWYRRAVFVPLMCVSVAAGTFLLWHSALYLRLIESIAAQASIYFGLMFCVCMVCHGELVKLKPCPQYLTMFYLAMSAGGAAGGLFVGLVSPMIFDTLFELPIGILAACGLTVVVLARDKESWVGRANSRPVVLGLFGLVIALGFAMKGQADRITRSTLAIARNFYGVVRVDRFRDSLVMRHGQIRHGHQFVDAERRTWPTTYYGPQSGAGIALTQHRAGEKKRVGVIGLGAGTLAVYAKPGDYYRMYEINPAVTFLAREYFMYLSLAEGDCEVITGDARICLEHEKPQQFDVLVLDAFSGDAVPTHLLTRECCELYLKHLKSDGILAFHITNRHVNLRPVCNGLAEKLGLQVVGTLARRDREAGTQNTLWVLMSRSEDSLASLDLGTTDRIDMEPKESILWTDDWSDLLSVMRAPDQIRVLRRGEAEASAE